MAAQIRAPSAGIDRKVLPALADDKALDKLEGKRTMRT